MLSWPLRDDARGDAIRLRDFNTLTFDVVGTLIDFETGILDWFRPTLRKHGASKTNEKILTAFATVEGEYQRETPEKAFTEMLPLIYRGMMSGGGAWNLATKKRSRSGTRSSRGPLSRTP